MAWSGRTIIPESCAHLDFAAIAAEFVRTRGNVSGAAKALKVPTRDLRKLVWSNEELVDAVFEAVETAVDDALASLIAGLRSPDFTERLRSASAVLSINPAARRRGWGRGGRGAQEQSRDVAAAAVTLRWLDA
jgi:hypothetical protein